MAKKKNEFKGSSDILKAMLDGMKGDTSTNVVDWILTNNFKTEDGHLISFTERPYLVQMLNDMSPTQAIMSGSQLGKTVNYYFKALYFNFTGKNVLFSEPTQDLRDALTKTKLNRLIEANELLRNNVRGDLNIKHVKDRVLHLTYTFGNAPVGITSDVNFYDEVSLSNTETVNQWTGRLMNSKFQYEYFVSNPQQPNDLLHNKFLDSNQNHWAIKCPHCSKRQILNYDGMYGYGGNFNKETFLIECQYCKGILMPEDIKGGEWVERFQGRHSSGYWLWQGMRVFDNLDVQTNFVRKMVSEEKKSKAAFYSMFLGLPYSGSDLTVNKHVLMKNRIDPTQFKNYVAMGVDIGGATGNHYVIGSGDTIFKIGRAKDWNEIRALMKEYAVQMCVVDQNPEYTAAKEFQAEYPNMVWRANYVGNKTDNLIQYKEEDGLVNIARNLIFDQMVNEFNDGKYKFAFREDDGLFDEYGDHWATMSKIPKLDAVGNPTFSWSAPEGAWDHFAHATLYYHIARHRLEQLMPRFGILQSEDGENARSFNGQERDRFTGSNKNKSTSWLDL